MVRCIMFVMMYVQIAAPRLRCHRQSSIDARTHGKEKCQDISLSRDDVAKAVDDYFSKRAQKKWRETKNALSRRRQRKAITQLNKVTTKEDARLRKGRSSICESHVEFAVRWSMQSRERRCVLGDPPRFSHCCVSNHSFHTAAFQARSTLSFVHYASFYDFACYIPLKASLQVRSCSQSSILTAQ